MQLSLTAFATLIIAITGLFSAVAGLMLTFIVWRDSRARIQVRVAPDSQNSFILSSSHSEAVNIRVSIVVDIEVANIGGKKATITTLKTKHYHNLASRIMRKSRKGFEAPYFLSMSLPYEIDVGQHYKCHITQTPELAAMGQKGWLYVAVFHTGAMKKPVYKRLKMNKKPTTKDETPSTKEQVSS